MAAKQTRKKTPTDTRSVEDRLIDAALGLAATQRWRDIRLPEIAAAADVELGAALIACPTKLHILKALARRTDAAVFNSLASDPLDGSTKDKLFDLLMRRFDAHEGHQAALATITADTARDPMAAICMAASLSRAMTATLEAAGVSTSGVLGGLRVKALGAIYLAAAGAWFKDEDPGLATTMARLDKGLNRAEQLESTRSSLRNRGNTADPAPVAE